MDKRFQRTGGILVKVGLCCVIVVAGSTALVARPRGSEIKVDAKVESPQVIAVRIRHDMCPYCRELDPQYPQVIKKAGKKSVLFVTLDLTDATSQKQAALMVGALGLDAAWTGDMSKMGAVMYLDGQSKQVLSSVQTSDTTKIRASLREALKASRSKE